MPATSKHVTEIRGLTPAKRADRIHRMLRRSSVAEVSALLGLSASHVRNLARLREKLAPEVWAKFQREGFEARLVTYLSLAALPASEQARRVR